MTTQAQQREIMRAEMLAAQASGERPTSPYCALAFGYQPGDLVGDDVTVSLPDQSTPGALPGQTGQGQTGC